MKAGDLVGHEFMGIIEVRDMECSSVLLRVDSSRAWSKAWRLDQKASRAVVMPQDVGPDVKNFKRGDRVVSSFDMGCGHCFYCDRGLFTGCANTNPSELQAKMYGQSTAGFHGELCCCLACMHCLPAAVATTGQCLTQSSRDVAWHAGYSHLTGGAPGGQAEYSRVRYGGVCAS